MSIQTNYQIQDIKDVIFLTSVKLVNINLISIQPLFSINSELISEAAKYGSFQN